ncbi:hypothetical protein [Desulfothermobacter acidiphilus]|uniref:hypothetical protein n=1 Tax=Desulfothermobacter acidiphilus TaxID=1938353 RepID=UPI003F8A94AE
MNRIAGLYSGSKWQKDLFHRYRDFFSKIIYACRLPQEDLSECQVFLVPRESNQEALLQAQENILAFLRRGGLVIALGEITVPWLPYVRWIKKESCYGFIFTGTAWEKGKLEKSFYHLLQPSHPLFRNLTIDDLQWHFHGYFTPPAGAEALLEYGGKCLICFDKISCPPGAILASTLDPEVHVGYGVVEKPKKFWENILIWAADWQPERTEFNGAPYGLFPPAGES